MRILVLTNLYPPHFLGGYEVICKTVVDELRSRGHDIRILTSNHTVGDVDSVPQEKGVRRVLRIHGFYGHPWLGIAALQKLERWNNQILRSTIERDRPDLVYVWNMGGLSKSLLLTLQRIGIPTAFYLSDHWLARGLVSDVWLRWWNKKRSSVRNRIVRAVWTAVGFRRRIDKEAPTDPVSKLHFRRLYFCSNALKRLTIRSGLDVHHASVIYPPVDMERFQGTPRNEGHAFARLLYVGRLSEDKGVFTVLRALDRLKGRFRGTLNICGRGEPAYENLLRSFVRDRCLPVTFSSVGTDAMPRVYQNHDGLLFPSEWEEPFALTPIEAMASGLPVIGTTTGGSAEFFRNEENALTYPAGDDAALAECILRMARDTALRSRCSAAGHAEARTQFAASTIVDQIQVFLEETVQAWGQARTTALQA